ncbi:MAG TPA: methyltransferase domain-containing protein [Chloroflexota bacterium]
MNSESAPVWASAEAAEVWRQGAARRAQTLAQANQRLFEAAALRPGMRVLDLAAGTGEQSILAARIVGPRGWVLATDISATMLAGAADAARQAGLSNIEIRVTDAAQLEISEGSFDAAICRFGLMFMPDLQVVLERVRRGLKSDARFAALVWSTADRNPWIALQVDLVTEMGRMPASPPSILRSISLGAPGALERALIDAGFQDVSTSPVATPRQFASVDEAIQAMRSASPARGELTRGMTDAELEHYERELARRLAEYAQPDGRCVLPGEAILGAGRRP